MSKCMFFSMTEKCKNIGIGFQTVSEPITDISADTDTDMHIGRPLVVGDKL